METPPTPTSRPRRRYRAGYVALVIAIVFLGAAGYLWVRSEGWMSYWNGPSDWRSAPVVETSLEQPRWRKWVEGGAWRNLQFDVSPAEVRDLGRVRQLAARRGVEIDGVNQFLDEAVGTELQGMVGNRPGLFYARFVLGQWYQAKDDPDRGAAEIRQAYADAPKVIVQRYVYADGSPAAGLRVSSFEIEHNRVKNHSLDPSLKLGYWDLVTDDRGCVYLPAYDTVLRVTSRGFPDGLETAYPKLGLFEVNGKVGELPVAVVKKP